MFSVYIHSQILLIFVSVYYFHNSLLKEKKMYATLIVRKGILMTSTEYIIWDVVRASYITTSTLHDFFCASCTMQLSVSCFTWCSGKLRWRL